MSMKTTIPDNISEEYYQISPRILSSFPKFRPPLDLFLFNEEVCQLLTYSRKGTRLSNEQVEEVARLAQEGDLFVSRADHPIYAKHICKQLDLVLVDDNLTQAEVADILVRGLTESTRAFFEQPVPEAYEALHNDILVFTEYLGADIHRSKAFMRRLSTEHDQAVHAMNTAAVGLWLYFDDTGREFSRRHLDRTAEALFLHDMGMSKIPAFIQTKTQPLTQDDRMKINQHPLVGAKIAHKLGLAYDEVVQAVTEHHERMDGSGYPRKLTGRSITKMGRLTQVADSFAAMIAERPYSPAQPPADAAAALAKDKRRYEEKFTLPLQAAYATNVF